PGRRRRLGRRGGALAVAAAVCLGTGGAIAALTLDDEPHPQTQREIRSALALPAPDRDSLTPVPGGIREAFRAETPLGTWVIATIETRGRGTLVTLGPLRADGSIASTGIGGCPEDLPRGGRAIGPCGGSLTVAGPGEEPGLTEMHGRVSPEVAAIEAVMQNDDRVPGWVDGGFFLVLLDPDDGGVRSLVARDAGGRVIDSHPGGLQRMLTP
ncbi:MAG: hypothetical protein AB7V62_15175, partial [Thermoleophilia bacterium]